MAVLLPPFPSAKVAVLDPKITPREIRAIRVILLNLIPFHLLVERENVCLNLCENLVKKALNSFESRYQIKF
jgi:hypothetical protein